MITRESQEILTAEEVKKYFDIWAASRQYKLINLYKSYYFCHNPEIQKRHDERKRKGKEPNNLIQSAYYKTVVDTMAGYFLSNIQYTGDDNYLAILKNNNYDVKAMKIGTRALAYNYSPVYVYTVGDGIGKPKIRYAPLDPLELCAIYDTNLEENLFCCIRKYRAPDDVNHGGDHYYYDVIYQNLIMYYETQKNKENKELIERAPSKQIYFDECPVIIYKTNGMCELSSYDQIINYIVALDFILSGNADEIERLTDAILKLSKQLEEKDLNTLYEMKALMGVKQDDVAEYIQKNTSPEFRRYVSELLIQEIHKQAHVMDWYNPSSGFSGAVSAKALKTRLFDMDMSSSQIEKVYKDGDEKLFRLINSQSTRLGTPLEPVDIKYNRTTPDETEDRINTMKGVDFLSQETKVEYTGFDWDLEQERIEEEAGGKQSDINTIISQVMNEDKQNEENESMNSQEKVTEGQVDTGSGIVTLNGAQVTAAKEIVVSVSKGELSVAAGKAMIKIFFNLTDDQAASMFRGIEEGESANI